MKNRVRCYGCKNKTNDPKKVDFMGWDKSLQLPTKINLCPRCYDSWMEDLEMLK